MSVMITKIGGANVSFGLSSRRKRTGAPGTKPGYGATNLGGHRDDRIHRHAAVKPHKRSGDAAVGPIVSDCPVSPTMASVHGLAWMALDTAEEHD